MTTFTKTHSNKYILESKQLFIQNFLHLYSYETSIKTFIYKIFISRLIKYKIQFLMNFVFYQISLKIR